MTMRRFTGVALGLLVATAATGQEMRTLEVDDLFAIRSVGSPRVSPDGEWVAYTVSATDPAEGERSTRLWMVPLSGGDPLPMTLEGGSVSAPAWSPDGRWLSFLAARDGGKTQVWALDRRGGEAQELTDVEQGVSGYEWSPDGARLLLAIRDPEDGAGDGDGGDGDDGDADDAGDDAGSDDPEPHVIDRLQFKRDYAGYLDRRRTHYYVYDLGSEETVQVTAGDYDDSGGVWSPDGGRVVFVSNRTAEPDANDNTDLWVVDVPASSSDGVPEPTRLTTNPGADGSPAFSPDGRWIAYTRSTQPERIWYAVNELAVIPAAGGEPRPLTAGLDRNVYGPAFGPGGRIWFVIEDSGERHLARVSPDGRRLERVVTGEGVVSSPALGPTGAVVLLMADERRPYEVFALDGSTPRRLTRVNDAFLAGIRLGAVRNIHFRSEDGTGIEGWVTLPPDADGGTGSRGSPYPTLLWIHGGPVAQYDRGFDFTSQLFAAHGYAVVRANPRGSSGYGQAFSEAIWADWGNRDYQDVMAAVDHAIAEGWADPDRLGVGGWSYGGILTNYVITRTDRFKGAMSGASEVLYRSNYGHDHYQRHWEAELGLPWGETAENWERISPFNRVENVVTPTLIMGGQLDWTVPILNSEQLYQALRRLGRETLLVVYPGEHHGIRTPAFQKDRLERWLDWYDLYVKGELDAPRADWKGALERLRSG
jgi:dipeptidyl aminopeptidase/acylaminoacyl peptidase